MSNSADQSQAAGAWPRLSYLKVLTHFVASYARATPFLLLLGTLSAVAEVLGISLVVLFVYISLGHSDDALQVPGFLATIFGVAHDIVAGNAVAMGALVFLAIAAKAALIFGYDTLTVWVRNSINKRVRRDLFNQYLTVSYDYIRRRDQGELVNILVWESGSVANAYFSLTRIAINLCTIGFFLVFLLAMSWHITAISACGAALVFFTRSRLTSSASQSGEKVSRASGDLAWHLIVAIQAMRTIRAFAREGLFEERFEEASSRAHKASVSLERKQSLIPPLSEIGYLGVLGLIVIAANELAIPFAITFVAVAQLYRLQPHLRELDSHLLALTALESSLRLVGRMLDRGDKAYPPSGSEPFYGLKTELRFEDVSLTYGDSEEPSLVKATFSIPAGQTTAIVGPSGAGKTTIINLILRLYEPDSGAVLADGKPITAFDRQSWLSRVAVTGQDIELIEATVADNIALGAPDATLDEIEEAAVQAGVREFIPEGAEGLDLWVGDRGLSLSGGQRQRVSLARALIRRPDILILDEAMSALNDELAEEIRRNTAKVMQGKTVVLITHRMDVALKADHVIWLSDGRIVELTSAREIERADRPRDRAL